MKLYVEYKPCIGTLESSEYTYINFNPYGPACFIDGKCINDKGFYISEDYRFVYSRYNGYISTYRITNISSKPIVKKTNKITTWKNIQKRIDELKIEQKNIIKKRGNFCYG